MTPTKNRPTCDKAEIAETTFHLVHPTSGGQPLCGVRAPSAMIGSYVEHLDTSSAENPRWVREIIGSDGKAVTPCALCLSLYPAALIDVVPFDLVITVHFRPNESTRGYNVTSSAFATVGGKRRAIEAYPQLTYFSAKWIGTLEFE